ncbi:MAG: YqeG family HAD IIIA-type phosphatase [Cyanobacteriota bacterium]|nr:YqeG family HAD IIIA-type phosphatase [Cyanobacteriota bacterium]
MASLRSLPQLLRPDWMVSGTLAQVPLDQLIHKPSQPIRALVLDVDRTLLPRHRGGLPTSIERWLQLARQQLPIQLLSNNPSRRRIGGVAQQLDLPFTTAAGKPGRAALRRVLCELNLPPQQVALIGDRLFTDVVAGNRLGLFTVLVKPTDCQGEPCQGDRLQKLELRLARWLGTSLHASTR